MDGTGETREVERLFLDSIDTAEHCLYIENQFFTSSIVAERIARRMQAKPALETLLIGPQNHEFLGRGSHHAQRAHPLHAHAWRMPASGSGCVSSTHMSRMAAEQPTR